MALSNPVDAFPLTWKKQIYLAMAITMVQPRVKSSKINAVNQKKVFFLHASI